MYLPTYLATYLSIYLSIYPYVQGKCLQFVPVVWPQPSEKCLSNTQIPVPENPGTWASWIDGCMECMQVWYVYKHSVYI